MAWPVWCVACVWCVWRVGCDVLSREGSRSEEEEAAGRQVAPTPERPLLTQRPPAPASACRREGATRQEAEDLVATALALAMSRDGSSGGVIR